MKLLNSFISDIQNAYKLHKMGFIQDQNGIIRRFKREKQNWDDHMTQSKSFILKSAKNKENLPDNLSAKQADKAGVTCAVLGSGWLLDLPLDELSEMFTTDSAFN